MSGAIQRAFLFSMKPCLCANPYFSLWRNKCWKPIHFLLEGTWKKYLLESFFSSQENNNKQPKPTTKQTTTKPNNTKNKQKKPHTTQSTTLSQLRLWVVKYPTDTAAGDNGAVARERLQRPQEEDFVGFFWRFSLSKRGLSFQPAREGQGQGSTQGGLLSHSWYGVMFYASLSCLTLFKTVAVLNQGYSVWFLALKLSVSLISPSPTCCIMQKSSYVEQSFKEHLWWWKIVE